MSYNTVPGSFRHDGNGINLADSYTGPGTLLDVQRTTGATILDRVSLATQFGPQYGTRWQVQNVSITAYLSIVSAGMCGKLGKFIGGVIIDPNIQPMTTKGPGANAFSTPMRELPQDPSLTVSLWDPAQEPMPPATSPSGSPPQASQLLPVTATVQLPTPIRPLPIVDIIVGIWLTPSLVTVVRPGSAQGLSIYAYNSIFNVGYDDGR